MRDSAMQDIALWLTIAWDTVWDIAVRVITMGDIKVRDITVGDTAEGTLQVTFM